MSDSLVARIRRVENGLLPAIVIANDSNLHSGFNIEDRLRVHQVPAISIALIHNGGLEWAKAYGRRDIDTRSPADERTLFQAASLSKPVTALASLALVENGRLSLERDVNSYLKSWRIPENSFATAEKVTLARLLSHCAGLPAGGYDGYESGDQVPTLVQVLDGLEPANSPPVMVVAEPGSQCVYGGAAYSIVQQLIVDIADTDFNSVLRRTVFEPIGMNDSYFLQPLPEHLVQRAAFGHHEDSTVHDGCYRTYPELAAAGLWTTPTDLALFLIDILDTSNGVSEKAVSREMASRIITPQQGRYGLGLNVIEKPGRTLVGHGGMNRGFRSKMIAYVERGDGVVAMANSENGDRIIAELVRSVSREYGWPDYKPAIKQVVSVDADVLAGIAGAYVYNEFINYELIVVDGRLLFRFRSEPVQQMYAQSPDTFFTLDGVEIIIGHDERGAVTEIDASNYRGTFTARRVD